MTTEISPQRLANLNAFWEAANYLSVGQIYLRDNPLLREPFKPEQIKPRLLGHFGTSPGLTLIYAHLNRLIQDTDADVLLVVGPGHGGPAILACAYLENCMTEVYPQLTMDITGMNKLMRQFSWPGGIPSHVSPPTPGSIHEGGELGYSLVHAYGSVFDNPNLITVCVVGDGEAETGPLAGGWHGNKFVNPVRDGAVLPILHLNGYKIAGPTVFGRMPDEQIAKFFEGCGHQVRFVEGDDPTLVHKALWETLDWAYAEIKKIQQSAKIEGVKAPAPWPMMVLRTPKGWTGPKIVDGKQIEGTFRAHQVPLAEVIKNQSHFKMLEEWLRSYHPDQHFDEKGFPSLSVLSLIPKPQKRLGASPYGNGGLLLKDLKLPDYTDYAV
ncbi:MAG: phosphoketolase, partial [Beggiatoa sp. IS2]